jgi:hypothetical protein
MTEINVVTDEQSPKEVIFNELFYSIHGNASNNSLFYVKNNIYEAINKPREVYENILELIIRDLVLWDYSYSLLNRKVYPFIILTNRKEGGYFKKGGKLWIRVFPDKPVTFKGSEVGMGGGNGGVDHYVYPINPGRMIFEIDGLKEDVAREALEGAATKLPIKTKFVKKENI